jgi:preprotein translocase subunit SecE
MFKRWMTFLTEVRRELGSVSWPTREATIGSTVVVLIAVFIIGIFLGVLDLGLSKVVGILVG